MTITHSSGIYDTAWVSNVANNGGADLKTDIGIGWSKEFGTTGVDLSVMFYAYPGTAGFNYAEFTGRLSQAVGPVTMGTVLAYAPKQNNIGAVDNLYIGVSGEAPVADTPLTLSAAFGFGDVAFGDNKLNWSTGAEYELGNRLPAGASYVNSYRSRLREGRAGIIANLRFEF